MIILDANILLYAYDGASPHHKRARDWVNRVFSSGAPVGLPWQNIGAFLRIVSDPRLPGERKTPEDAVAVVSQWLEQPNLRCLAPNDQHWRWLREIMTEGQAPG